MLLRSVFAALALAACLPQASAHDPSAWGGTFRSRDGGLTWLPIDGGQFVGGAMALAVDPADSNHLLYATDTRLLRSRNGGRDWAQEPAAMISGPTLTVAFDAAGNTALTATSAGIFRAQKEASWAVVDLSVSANPALAIVSAPREGGFYVVGADGFYRSDDGGRTWTALKDNLPGVPSSIAVIAQPSESVIAVVQGRLYASADRGLTWRELRSVAPAANIETVAADRTSGRVWAAGSNQVYRSDDAGTTWAVQGSPLPEAGTSIRGIAASADLRTVLLTTHRGLFRSTDAGASWSLTEGSLPVHLEAGPLVHDPRDAQTLYAGFSLTPYKEIRRRAIEGSNLLSQIDPFSLAGGAAFLVLILAAAIYAVRKLLRISAAANPTPSSGTRQS